MKPEPTALKSNPLCIQYTTYLYYNDDGKQHHTNRCKLIDTGDRLTTCGTLRKNRKCPRLRSEYPVRHDHKGTQLHLGGYRA